ncbi:MAG: FkbM family methyltransferase [Mesorhizobium sp.]|nr:MAG: FkbM family methyltransferase [Mesorhizobium sp.]TIM01821.1 MAG: FkbM family methyltransferase [Mesorhizobium sp.]
MLLHRQQNGCGALRQAIGDERMPTISRVKSAFARGARSYTSARLPLANAISRLSTIFIAGYENYSHDATYNGETEVLRRLENLDIGTVFDVGANVGNWTDMACKYLKGAQIFAFEPAPRTFRKLSSVNRDRVKCVNAALSDTTGTQEFHFYKDKDTVSTLIVQKGHDIHQEHYEAIAVECIRGDEFMESAGVSRIGFLKIDTEGAEKKVLDGFGAKLFDFVDIIQFEYGMGNIYSRFLLKDAYEMLGDRFDIGRIMPKGVEFRNYSPYHENFRTPNFLAVSKRRPEVKARLSL